MPVRKVSDNPNCYQWGNQKVYCGKGAKAKAIKQGIAIENTGWKEAETNEETKVWDWSFLEIKELYYFQSKEKNSLILKGKVYDTELGITYCATIWGERIGKHSMRLRLGFAHWNRNSISLRPCLEFDEDIMVFKTNGVWEEQNYIPIDSRQIFLDMVGRYAIGCRLFSKQGDNLSAEKSYISHSKKWWYNTGDSVYEITTDYDGRASQKDSQIKTNIRKLPKKYYHPFGYQLFLRDDDIDLEKIPFNERMTTFGGGQVYAGKNKLINRFKKFPSSILFALAVKFKMLKKKSIPVMGFREKEIHRRFGFNAEGETKKIPIEDIEIGSLILGGKGKWFILTKKEIVGDEVKFEMNPYGTLKEEMKGISNIEGVAKLDSKVVVSSPRKELLKKRFGFGAETFEAHTNKWKVGDKVRVLNNKDGHGFKVGEIVTVAIDNPSTIGRNSYNMVGDDGVRWIIAMRNAELVGKDDKYIRWGIEVAVPYTSYEEFKEAIKKYTPLDNEGKFDSGKNIWWQITKQSRKGKLNTIDDFVKEINLHYDKKKLTKTQCRIIRSLLNGTFDAELLRLVNPRETRIRKRFGFGAEEIKYKEGDKVRIINNNGFRVGEIVTVMFQDEEYIPEEERIRGYYMVENEDTGKKGATSLNSIEAVSDDEDEYYVGEEIYKLGDLVEVGGNYKGEIGTLIRIQYNMAIISFLPLHFPVGRNFVDDEGHVLVKKVNPRLWRMQNRFGAEEIKYEVGDKVRFLNNKDGHGFKVGDIVTIVSKRIKGNGKYSLKVKSTDGWGRIRFVAAENVASIFAEVQLKTNPRKAQLQKRFGFGAEYYEKNQLKERLGLPKLLKMDLQSPGKDGVMRDGYVIFEEVKYPKTDRKYFGFTEKGKIHLIVPLWDCGCENKDCEQCNRIKPHYWKYCDGVRLRKHFAGQLYRAKVLKHDIRYYSGGANFEKNPKNIRYRLEKYGKICKLCYTVDTISYHDVGFGAEEIKYEVGDKVKLVRKIDDDDPTPLGTIFIISKVLEGGCAVQDNEYSDAAWLWEEIEMVEKVGFKIGDKAKVVAPLNDDEFEEGEIVTITALKSDERVMATNDEGRTILMAGSELEKYTPPKSFNPRKARIQKRFGFGAEETTNKVLVVGGIIAGLIGLNKLLGK